jgi:glycosyltransferase involved in cell wall biosynthesis
VRVSVIIPAHNEAQAIRRVLADLPADVVTEVLEVDSNSTDGTVEITEGMGDRRMRERPQRCYDLNRLRCRLLAKLLTWGSSISHLNTISVQ